MILDGDLIGDCLPSYELGREVGRGAWGIVYEGVHRHLGRRVAIKQLPRAFGADPVVRRRFLSEAKLLATLEHPHIVPIYDYVERDGLCVLVMELLDGGSVWNRFEAGSLAPETACAIGAVSAVALHRAHQHGVLHRDVKPDNVLFSGSGTLKVTDFGIAKVRDATSSMATRAGEVLGTPAYMAPEQAQGTALGPPTDIYSLGVMLYELLAGRLPFGDDLEPMALLFKHVYEAPPPLAEVADVATAVADVVMRALAKVPEDRYPTAEEFGVALAAAATATWGPGWMTRGAVVLLGGGPVAAAADRPVVPLTLTTLHAQRDVVGDLAPATTDAPSGGASPTLDLPPDAVPRQPERDASPTVALRSGAVAEDRGDDPAGVLAELPALVDDLRASGRGDLADRVDGALAVARSVGGTVWVTGAYKAGKSALVNALVGEGLCPVDDDAPSTVLTIVRSGPPRAVVRRRRGPGVQDQVITSAEVAAFALETGNPANIRGVETLELTVALPERLAGFVFVDTPGSSWLGSPVSAVCLGFPASVGVVLHIVRGTVPLDEEELVFLEQIDARGIPIVVATTRIDLESGWRRSVEAVTRQLADRGVDAPVIGVSSLLRRLAQGGATIVDEESGVPRLIDALAAAGREHRARRALATVVPDTLVRVQAALERQPSDRRSPVGPPVGPAPAGRAPAVGADPSHPEAPWRLELADRLRAVAASCGVDVRRHVAGIRERLSPVAGDAVSLADWDRLVGAVQREVVGATVLIGEELTGGLGALVADVVHELGVDPGRRPGPRAVPSPELEATVALRLQGLAWRLLSVPGLPLSTSSPLSLLVHDGGSGWPRDASSGERTAVVANLAELLDTTALELTDAVHRLAVEAEAVIVEEVATRIRERDREREAVAALPDTAVDPLTLAARVGELVSRMPAPAPAPVGTGP